MGSPAGPALHRNNCMQVPNDSESSSESSFIKDWKFAECYGRAPHALQMQWTSEATNESSSNRQRKLTVPSNDLNLTTDSIRSGAAQRPATTTLPLENHSDLKLHS